MTTYRLDPEPTDVDTVWCETSSGEFEKFEKRTPYGTSGVRWESEHYYYTWSELLAEYVSVSTVNPRLDVADLTPFPWGVATRDSSYKTSIDDANGYTIAHVYTSDNSFTDDEKIAAFIVRAVNSYVENAEK